jgi:catechol 2,3-dioxygenase-like lactoylglutathione lyase family enzyme
MTHRTFAPAGVLLALALVSADAGERKDPLSDPAFFPMDIEHFALNVSEPVAAAAWYVRHLGMRVVRALSESPFTHFLADGSGRVVVELYAHPKAPVPDYRAMDPLVFHIALATADVRGTRERLLAAGATGAGDVGVTPAGDEMTFLRDPWGVALQLVRRATPLL